MSTDHAKAFWTEFQIRTSHTDVVSGHVVLFLTFVAFGFAFTVTAAAQRKGSSPAMPGVAIRERNRQMDEYDRLLDRLKNPAKAPSERRKNLFPQINEDFQKIQVIHNEMIRLIQSEDSLKYDRLIELTSDLKKRGNRLRTNLALPSADDERSEKSTNNPMAPSDDLVKQSVVTLHDVIVSFVTNPLFKNLGLLDARVVSRASDDLNDIILLSDSIKKNAATLGKIAKK